jgi:uncharacterized lipoprotein YddW (UPF0748 family)
MNRCQSAPSRPRGRFSPARRKQFQAALCAAALLSALGAPALGAEPRAAGPPMRGVFADAFGTQYRNHLNTTRLVDQLRLSNVQHCFLQVCVLGEGFYASSVLPRPAGLPVGYEDPLADILVQLSDGTTPSVKIHAWISPFQTHNARAILAPPPGHVGLEHPDWLTEDVEGNRIDAQGWYYLDPGRLDVQNHVAFIAREIAKNYNVAGIHLDGFLYPEQGYRFGYNQGALERFFEETGAKDRPDPQDPVWLDWRRRQLRGLVARISQEVKEIRSGIVVSVSATVAGSSPKNADGFRYSQAYSERLQDWLALARFGLVDWICVQNFWDEHTESRQFNDWAAFAVENRGEAKIWIAVAGYRNWAIDAFRQIQRSLINHCDGVAVYNFRQPVRDVATAHDFFSAMRAITILSDYQLPPFAKGHIMPEDLRQSLERMRKAAELPIPPVAEGPSIAPGVGPLPPAATIPAPPGEGPGADSASPPPPPDGAGAASAEKLALEAADILGATTSGRLPFQEPWDTIFLTNRSVFEGRKMGESRGESLFETSSGVIIKIHNQYIDHIKRSSD